MTWQSRIISEGEEDPEQLLANPLNWRIHPEEQQRALSGVLDEVGWVTRVIVNQRTGHLVDGHLRVILAMRKNEKSVPVTYVDLSESEEAKVLATLDPLSAMAKTDKEKLDELLREVSTGDDGLQEMLSKLAEEEGLVPPMNEANYQESFNVLVVCQGEQQQADLFERLTGEGYECLKVSV